MDQKTAASDRPRMLVVILGTHRSGSSLTTNILHQLGMSLGPFDLIGSLESNRHGHFEAAPINHFDMQLQKQIFAFDGDMPHTVESLNNLLQTDGRWHWNAHVSESDLEFGRFTVQQIVDSGDISGFKDPRIVLLWPYWREVLRGFPGLRILLLTLLRSPHEIAMSIFMRSRGRYTYHDALNVAAVNLRRIQDISQTWDGERALVRFDPRVFADDLHNVTENCGLPWSDDVFNKTYDPNDRHHDPTRVAHDAQRLFDEMASLPHSATDDSMLFLARDSALREKLIQHQRGEDQQQQLQMREELARLMNMAQSIEAEIATLCDNYRKHELHHQVLELPPLARTAQFIHRVYRRFRGQGDSRRVA